MMKRMKVKDMDVVVYEPIFSEEAIYNSRVIVDLEVFNEMCVVIIANRMSDLLRDIAGKGGALTARSSVRVLYSTEAFYCEDTKDCGWWKAKCDVYIQRDTFMIDTMD
ncbi:MAG: hypothetical protein LBM69_00530 [Lachnospiraceae bacterium]|jgi:hypothetical protein|nr:hypothetical protein [Lachnospiraceae bacterium]